MLSPEQQKEAISLLRRARIMLRDFTACATLMRDIDDLIGKEVAATPTPKTPVDIFGD